MWYCAGVILVNGGKMDEQNKKKIDDSWKERAEKEKEEAKNVPQDENALPPIDFKFFITTLGLQASIALGYIPNPVTQEK
jgi:hypothetical protein